MATFMQTLFWPVRTASRTRPMPPERPRMPVLMGDILTQRGGEPELLIQWRAAQARNDDPDSTD